MQRHCRKSPRSQPSGPRLPLLEGGQKLAAVSQPTPEAAPAKTEAVEAAVSQECSPAEREKRVKAIKKKLQQIDKLKERVGELDADAAQKVASEPELLRELAALGGVVDDKPTVAAPSGAAPSSKAPAPAKGEPAQPQEVAPKREDPHKQAREDALQPPPEDLGLLLDDETERRKKLRDMGKLHDKEHGNVQPRDSCSLSRFLFPRQCSVSSSLCVCLSV